MGEAHQAGDMNAGLLHADWGAQGAWKWGSRSPKPLSPSREAQCPVSFTFSLAPRQPPSRITSGW